MKTPFVSRRARRQLARVTNRAFVPQPNPTTRFRLWLNPTTGKMEPQRITLGADIDGVPFQRAQAMRGYRGAYAHLITDALTGQKG